jgi:hypothetical protein
MATPTLLKFISVCKSSRAPIAQPLILTVTRNKKKRSVA